MSVSLFSSTRARYKFGFEKKMLFQLISIPHHLTIRVRRMEQITGSVGSAAAHLDTVQSLKTEIDEIKVGFEPSYAFMLFTTVVTGNPRGRDQDSKGAHRCPGDRSRSDQGPIQCKFFSPLCTCVIHNDGAWATA